MGVYRDGGPANRVLGDQGSGQRNQPTRCGAAQASGYGCAHLDAVFRHLCKRLVDEAPQVGSRAAVYTILIMRASREFSGIAWAQCDTAYRRQVANMGSRHWSQINSLYCTLSVLLDELRALSAASCVPRYSTPLRIARSPPRHRWRRH